MNYYIGSYGISPYNGVCSPVYIVLTPRNDVVDSRFAFRIFEDGHFQEYAQSFGNGILEHRRSINWDILKTIPVPVPPLPEQRAIASFLDRETSKIDALVSEQRRLVELLKEKRQAVISHAVTKGLDPSVPMKPSGIPWLGDVPAHWEIKAVRRIGQLQNGLNIEGEAFGSGYPFVSYGDVYSNPNVPETPSGLVQSSEDDRIKCSLKIGDVLFTRTSETVDDIGIASTCLKAIPRSTFAGFLIRLRPTQGILNPDYSTYLFRNEGVQRHFAGAMNLVTRASLSQDLLKTLPICIPPFEEQGEIAAFINTQIETFTQLQAEANRAIALLQERRTALISAAVTGQIDVRAFLQKGTA
jgi:type I restriction enzyme S subunit